MKTPQYPPLLLKYLKMFQDDPTSRIFAPLAEAYRKIGLVDEAIEICREGLVANPHFIGGKVALARAYHDKGVPAEVVAALRPIIDQIPDNLMAQRLYADSCLTLGFVPDALGALKLLMYFNPEDQETAGVVSELETKLVQGGSGLLRLGDDPRSAVRLARLQGLLERLQKRRSAAETFVDRS